LAATYGWNPAGFVLTWVHDKEIRSISNCKMTIKSFNNQTQGVCLAYTIPELLQPKLPAQQAVDKFDNNYGVAEPWVKIALHLQKNGMASNYNLPRILWIKKTWTLVEMHQNIFNHFRDLFLRWYKDIADSGRNRSRSNPEYKWKGEKMDYAKIQELFEMNDVAEQFGVFFPTLNEENWESVLGSRSFSQKDLPYQLRLENTSGYLEDCHFCGNRSCRSNCPCPFTSKMTVLDLLHKVGVEDNISFYEERGMKKGKTDVIIDMIWQSDFEDIFIKQLSSMTAPTKLDTAPVEDTGMSK
jgi:hypothetical protein